MGKVVENAIIGAGPYGLALAAHFGGAKLDFAIVGRPMDAWRNHMPEGMLLKSDGFASNLYDPRGEVTLEKFCRERKIPYDDMKIPVKLDTFVEYGMTFAKQFAPNLKNALVVSLERSPRGFELKTDDGDTIFAQRVIVAAGVGPFKFTPPELAALGPQVVSHSYDHHDLSKFAGRRVAVVGAGASAIDLAGLLYEKGAASELICRADNLRFWTKQARSRSVWERLRAPDSGLGPGWRSRLSTDAPLLFHVLPASMRLPIVERHLGPAASGYMKDMVVGKVRLLTGREIVGAEANGDAATLSLRTAQGQVSTESFDHVIAATGYRVDVRRLDFIGDALRREIDCVEHTPILSSRFESRAKGLYFVGVAAANSFGPMLRFAFGAGFAARRVTGALKSRAVVPAVRHRPAADAAE